MKKILTIAFLAFSCSVHAQNAEPIQAVRSPVVGILSVNDTWLIKPHNGFSTFLFRPDALLYQGKPISADRTLFVEYQSGIISNSKFPFSEVKRFNLHPAHCNDYYFTKTNGERIKTFGCQGQQNWLIHAYKGDKDWVAVMSVSGTRTDLRTGRSYHTTIPFDMDSMSSFEVLSQDQLKQKQAEAAASLQRTEDAINKRSQAHLQAEQAKQIVLTSLRRSKIGTEDSCESQESYTLVMHTWYKYGDNAKVDCQFSGKDLYVKDFKDTGWMVTNVQRVDEHRFMMTVKKVR